MSDFKEETLHALQMKFGEDYEIDSYQFFYTDNRVEGRDKIDWNKVKNKLRFKSGFEYNNEEDGYDEIYGFITFKDHAEWLERNDKKGSNWWVCRVRPKL